MSIKSLETLETWRRAKQFSLRIYREVLPLLPSEEKWNINQQLRRASLSVPANIAEGYGRFYYQDNIRFCYIARGAHSRECFVHDNFKCIVVVSKDQADFAPPKGLPPKGLPPNELPPNPSSPFCDMNILKNSDASVGLKPPPPVENLN